MWGGRCMSGSGGRTGCGCARAGARRGNMQPQRVCEHTLARRGGIAVGRPSTASPRYEDPRDRCLRLGPPAGCLSRVPDALSAILHAPALRGSALSCRRWPGSRAPCVLTYYYYLPLGVCRSSEFLVKYTRDRVPIVMSPLRSALFLLAAAVRGSRVPLTCDMALPSSQLLVGRHLVFGEIATLSTGKPSANTNGRQQEIES